MSPPDRIYFLSNRLRRMNHPWPTWMDIRLSEIQNLRYSCSIAHTHWLL